MFVDVNGGENAHAWPCKVPDILKTGGKRRAGLRTPEKTEKRVELLLRTRRQKMKGEGGTAGACPQVGWETRVNRVLWGPWAVEPLTRLNKQGQGGEKRKGDEPVDENRQVAGLFWGYSTGQKNG